MEPGPVTSAALTFLLGTAALASAQTATTPGTAQAVATIYSIGVEWPVTGDTNHNATASVSYRVHGAAAWNAALPLVRVDYNGANTLAGSLLFLTPGTAYDVALSLTDPDGGSAQQTLAVTTRALPSLPTTGRTLHVVPGSGGGDGSQANPFRGIAAAQVAARSGDTLLLHAGDYGGRIALTKPGTVGQYLVWKSYGDGEVLFQGVDISGSHVWVEGITVRNQAYGLAALSNPDDVVVRRNAFYNNHYSILMEEGGRNWYIADNTIVGDTPYYTESLDGEGVELNSTGGHTVAHNSITSVADGISDPGANTDLFGNDIFDTSDDGIEADLGGANVRMWRNRIHNAVHNGISFQPQSGAPWYIIRNQIVGNVEAAFKFRQTDRFVLLHNTIVNWGNAWPGTSMMCCNEDHLLRAIARNNLWVSVQGGQIWGFDAGVVDWRTDLDYDGIDWGQSIEPFAYGGVTYQDIPSLTSASGLEAHGVRISRQSCFEVFDVPSPPPAPVPPQAMTLRADCNAVDKGVVLPDVNDASFTGAAPDLGAYERGGEVPVYGPRAVPAATLTVQPPSIQTGGSATLSWSTTDASSVYIDAIGAVAPTGSATVSPPSTTIYTLTATGPGGVATATATLTVSTSAVSTPYGGTPVSLPGTIEAERFDDGGPEVAYHDASAGNSGGAFRSTDVDLEATSDANGGYNIGWVSEGEWVNYTVNVAQAGSYTFDVRVANTAAGGAFHLEVNGVNLTGSIAVPNTDWWQTWTTVTTPGVSLDAGNQILRLAMDRAASNGAVGNFNWVRATKMSSGSSPYGGVPASLPGIVEAEQFDEGGAEVAYHDASPGNSGGAFRNTDVDIEGTADAGGGYDVGWTAEGEWLNYTVNVESAGSYSFAFRVANIDEGGRFHLEVNGTDVTGPLDIPNTGGWQTFTTVTKSGIHLNAGTQTLRLAMDASAMNAVGNVNRFIVTRDAGSTPYGGVPAPLPGTIEAERFDEGGAEVAYHDGSPGNSGGAFRGTDVDIEATTDTGGGYDVGWVSGGEWLNYTASVASAGSYTLSIRVANTASGGSFHVEVNGRDVTGPIQVPDTGAWQAWTTVSRVVSLASGTQVVRLVMDAAAANGAVGNFNWIRVQ